MVPSEIRRFDVCSHCLAIKCCMFVIKACSWKRISFFILTFSLKLSWSLPFEPILMVSCLGALRIQCAHGFYVPLVGEYPVNQTCKMACICCFGVSWLVWFTQYFRSSYIASVASKRRPLQLLWGVAFPEKKEKERRTYNRTPWNIRIPVINTNFEIVEMQIL